MAEPAEDTVDYFCAGRRAALLLARLDDALPVGLQLYRRHPEPAQPVPAGAELSLGYTGTSGAFTGIPILVYRYTGIPDY